MSAAARTHWLLALLFLLALLLIGAERLPGTPAQLRVLGFETVLLLAGVSLLLGVVNVLALHLRRIVLGQQDWLLSLLLIAVLIGVCVPLFNVGAVWPMARHAQRGFLRELVRNPLILGTATGLAANLLGFTLPVWLEPTVNRIGAASLALGLMAAGAGMQLGALGRAKALAVAVLTIRHFLMPLAALGLSRAFQLNPVQTTMLLAFSALPTASSCYVLAARMGYDGSYVAGLVTLSTLLGMASLPLALGVLNLL